MKKEIIILSVIIGLSSLFFGWYLTVAYPRQAVANIMLDKCLEAYLREDQSRILSAFMTSQSEKTQVGPWGCEWAANNYQKTGVWKY